MPMYHPMTFCTPTILRNIIHEALDGRAGAGDTGALRRVSEQHSSASLEFQRMANMHVGDPGL